jgi:hypothetical protein
MAKCPSGGPYVVALEELDDERDDAVSSLSE